MASKRGLRMTEAQYALFGGKPDSNIMPPSEKAFMAEIRKLAAEYGWMCYHTHDSRKSDEGWPDLVLLKGGRLIIAELKTEKGVLTTKQTLWIDALRNVRGIKVEVWRPSDGPEIRRILTA